MDRELIDEVGITRGVNQLILLNRPGAANLSNSIQHTPKLMRLSQSAAMLGGFLLLLSEVRFAHRVVLIDDWRPWIPIVFCGLMAMMIPMATLLWDRGGKSVLFGGYFLTACLGVMGLVFHSEGHLLQRLIEVSSVWSSTVQAGAAIKALHPPLLAPAAFIGLGSIGLIFVTYEQPDTREGLTISYGCAVKSEVPDHGMR